jgi:hypothetical protein
MVVLQWIFGFFFSLLYLCAGFSPEYEWLGFPFLFTSIHWVRVVGGGLGIVFVFGIIKQVFLRKEKLKKKLNFKSCCVYENRSI